MSAPYVGQVSIFGFTFAPSGWALCNGQIIPIAQNTALFSLLGTNYGGNGTSNFALPNLQGCAVLSQGEGAGLSPYVVGQTGGSESVTLNISELASHSHTPVGTTTVATDVAPTGSDTFGSPPASARHAAPVYGTGAAVTMGSSMVGQAGGGGPHNNIQPYLTLNFCIALQGIFPPRS